MEEAQEELISPRISFSHDLAVATPPPAAAALLAGRRSDASLLVVSRPSRLPAEPEFDFANAVAADDVAPADRLFAGGKLLPMPPLPPAAPKPTTPCKPQQPCRVKAQQEQQTRRPGSSWAASPFSRSSSVNSATTTTGAPRSAAGRFGCPPFPLMRSWSVGSAAAVARERDGAAAAVSDAAAGHRPRHQYYKKFGGAAAAATASNGGGSRAYYYGGSSRKGSIGGGSGRSHGVRVPPVLNVPFIGTSVSSVLSYLLCDCSSHKTKKSREF
ncbi:hypothetical protein BDA96_03G089100 [Sorghum bicolor]|uniref:Uncharacterized protein n=1 Tax=Sorghum bicolor TaxID=4558 RepID=A0A921RBL9_SORBI|nr:hypothetical protein BDA96_03G089100 [Sorghum bicolor]